MSILGMKSTVLLSVLAFCSTVVSNAKVAPKEEMCGPADDDSCVVVNGPFSMDIYPKGQKENKFSRIKLKVVGATFYQEIPSELPTFNQDGSPNTYENWKNAKYMFYDMVTFIDHKDFDNDGATCNGGKFEEIDGTPLQYACTVDATTSVGKKLNFTKVISVYDTETELNWDTETLKVAAGAVKETYVLTLSDELIAPATSFSNNAKPLLVELVWGIDFVLPKNLDEFINDAGITLSAVQDLRKDEEKTKKLIEEAAIVKKIDGFSLNQTFTDRSIESIDLKMLFNLNLGLVQSIGYGSNEDVEMLNFEFPTNFTSMLNKNPEGAWGIDSDFRKTEFDVKSVMQYVPGNIKKKIGDIKTFDLPTGAMFISCFLTKPGMNQYYIDPIIQLGAGDLTKGGMTLATLMILIYVGIAVLSLLLLCCFYCCIRCFCCKKKNGKNERV